MSREEASLFFRLLVRRYERGSLIVTSNKSFADWGEVFHDQILATAFMDRLLHHATTLNIKGESYRLREKKKAGLLGRRSVTAAEEVSADVSPEHDNRTISSANRGHLTSVITGQPTSVLTPTDLSLECGAVWQAMVNDANRERAFWALEVATLWGLHRAIRNGSVWIEHSLAFRGQDRLFIFEQRWAKERHAHHQRLGLPLDVQDFLAPLIEQATCGIAAVARAAEAGALTVDEDVHLRRLEAEEEDPQVAELRRTLNQQIGEAQLADLILSVDAEVRFSWIMLGREPRSHQELLMAYAGVLAHGTAMSAAETARMIPGLTAEGVRQAMRWASDEHRLREASRAVLTFMHRHPITQAWGRSDLASADMMSLDASRRVWQARIDPRRRQPGIGVYRAVGQTPLWLPQAAAYGIGSVSSFWVIERVVILVFGWEV